MYDALRTTLRVPHHAPHSYNCARAPRTDAMLCTQRVLVAACLTVCVVAGHPQLTAGGLAAHTSSTLAQNGPIPVVIDTDIGMCAGSVWPQCARLRSLTCPRAAPRREQLAHVRYLLSYCCPWYPLRVCRTAATDIDDTWAIAYVLSRPDLFDLRLVQLSTFNTTMRAQVAAKYLTAAGAGHVPLAVGKYTGEQDMPQYAWAADFSLDTYVANGGSVTHGTDTMRQLMRAASASAPLLILEIAPATSLGEILTAEPQLAANCIVVAMSGSIYRGYVNASQPTAEYNVATDVNASALMYAATWAAPLVTAPLDTTNFMQFWDASYRALMTANTSACPGVQALMTSYSWWYDLGGNTYTANTPYEPHNCSSVLFDPQAAWMAGQWAQQWSQPAPPQLQDLLLQRLPLVVNASGFTQPAAGGQPVYTAVGFSTAPYNAAADMGAALASAILRAMC